MEKISGLLYINTLLSITDCCCEKHSGIEFEPHLDHKTLIVHLIPIIGFGIGAILLGVFSLPGAFYCSSVLENHTHERLTIGYAFLKSAFIFIQVC